MQRTTIVTSLIALFLLASSAAFGAGGDKTKVKGIITSRTGETLILGSAEGGSVTVVLTDSTVTKDDKGLLGLDKKHLSSVVLIPGLKIEVDGVKFQQGAGPHIGEPTQEQLDWVSTAAIPIAGADPSLNYDDLTPLKDLIGSARIVGLGEATHGTSEFFRMKHRIIDFLAN